MSSSQESNDFDGDLKSLDSIVVDLRKLVKRAYAAATKECNRANDLEKKLKKQEKQSERSQKLKRQPLLKHSKNQPNALDDAVKEKDEEIEELRTFQKILEKINDENKQTIDDLRKDVRELNLELATKNFTAENCNNVEEIHQIYNSELKKLDEELQELREKEDLWKKWPKLKEVYEDEIRNLHDQIVELEDGTDEWKERIDEYEMEIDRLNSELHKRRRQGDGDMLFNGSAGLLMAGNGMTEGDIDFIVQDNVNELRDSHARDLGTVIPSRVGTNRQDNKMKCSNMNEEKEEYIRELEQLNQKNMEEIEYLKDRIEENRDYEDGDILGEVESLKGNHREEVRRLHEEIAMLRSGGDGDIWLEVEELKKEHQREVGRLQCEIEDMKIFDGEDISGEVEELKGNHLQEVEALRKELEIMRLNDSGDIFEEVEILKKRHSDEVTDLKNEIEFLESGSPGIPWTKHGEGNKDKLNFIQEEHDEEWALLVNAKEREIESLKKDIGFLKETEARGNVNPEDVPLLANEINRLNGIIQLMSKSYFPAPESPNIEDKSPDSKSDAVPDPNRSLGSTTKELEALNLVGNEATRAKIQTEYEDKMDSLQAEMFALKNIENEQIWKNAQDRIDEELEEINRDYLAMTNAKNAGEWARPMQLYDEIRRLKSELLAKGNRESTEIGRLREEVRFLKQELSDLRKANEHLSAPNEFGNIEANTEGRLHRTNPFYEIIKDEYPKTGTPSARGNEDEEMWNLEVRPLLEDIASLNNQVRQAEERLSTEKMNLEKKIKALNKENSELRRQMSEDSLDQEGPNKAYTDDEKLSKIIQELDHVQHLQVQADEKAANYERQLEEERSRHLEEMTKMADDLHSLQDSIDETEVTKAECIEVRDEVIKNLKNGLDDMRHQHEQEIQHIGEMCKEKTDALDEKISDLKISLGTRENELARRVREIEELLEKVEGLEEENERLKEEIQNKAKEIDERVKIIEVLRPEVEVYKHEIKRTLSEQEKTYSLYQEELGRVHIELLRTQSSHAECLKETEEARKYHVEELVLQKERLVERFESFIQELKRSHEDEIDQIRIEMLSTQDKFKKHINKIKNGGLSDDSLESIDGVFSSLSRNSSLESDEKKSADEHHPESSKSDSETFSDDILFENNGFEKSSNMNQADELDPDVEQRPPFISRQQSRGEDRMTQSLEGLDTPDNTRKDEKKSKNKKKSNKSKWRSRDPLPVVGSDEENLDEVELKEKQKQCRQQ